LEIFLAAILGIVGALFYSQPAHQLRARARSDTVTRWTGIPDRDSLRPWRSGGCHARSGVLGKGVGAGFEWG
jgi:hypothetical protein